MDDYQEYPRWLYGANGATVIVNGADHHDEFREGWYFTPEEAREGHGETPPVVADPSAAAKADLLARAEAVNLVVDNRWSVKNLAVKVMEAEDRAKAQSGS